VVAENTPDYSNLIRSIYGRNPEGKRRSLINPRARCHEGRVLELGEPAGDRKTKPEPADASIGPVLFLRKRFKQFARELLAESDSGVSHRYKCVP